MAKKNKEAEVVPSEVPDTGLLNPKTEVADDIVIDKVDFDDLLELEKAAKATEEHLNRVAGNILRLNKDLDLIHAHERKLYVDIDTKRKDLIKRYKVDEQRKWQIDLNSRKVVYQS